MIKWRSTRPETDDISKNFVKLNLTSLAVLNFSLQYERVLSKEASSGRIIQHACLRIPYLTYLADQFIQVCRRHVKLMKDIGAETEDIIRKPDE
ncbi:MAG: hypothetical protein MZU84_07165 [Sphingobacterium sp.]|nr:hypothetical protein [Sphingobacterium sp.]